MKKQNLIDFHKMVGAGNDFIVIEANKGIDYKKLAVKICDRSNGIGADGLLILDQSKNADFRMRIFNADGSEAEMCGNGARCLAAYIVRYKKPKRKLFTMQTLAGIIHAEAKGEIANVQLSDPIDYRPNLTIDLNGKTLQVHYIDTGVPHTIVYVADIKKIDVNSIGEKIRNHKAFSPRGTNANFVEQLDSNLVEVRTFERGVEHETKACGTGSVACALVSFRQASPEILSQKQAKMNVLTASGEVLQIQFDLTNGTMTNVWLKGSAKFIAHGQYYFT